MGKFRSDSMTDPASILLSPRTHGTSLVLIPASGWKKAHGDLPDEARNWVDAHGFKAEAGRHVVIPRPNGSVDRVLAGMPEGGQADPFAIAKLCRVLPVGNYSLEGAGESARLIALAWCLEAYGFGMYGKSQPETARLLCPHGVDREAILRAAKATYLVRDLVNTPASDMGPDELEAAARGIARAHKAKLSVVKGKALELGFPMIHAVGKASPRAPDPRRNQ
jgi:leucyl aminopeptidase